MPHTYDFIIIGSGLGGLQTAAILSKNGFSVCVLEKNRHIGGTLQTFERNGCKFSTGMHYVGSLEKGQMLHQIFRYFGLFDGITYKKMDEAFEVFNISGKEYSYRQGWEAWREQILRYFPDERHAIDTYIAAVRKTVEAQDLYNLETPRNTDILDKDFLRENAFQKIAGITSNRELQNVLGALNFVYAGEKEITPFYVHALINNYFINSAWRIVGESDQIALSLAASIRKNGGTVLTEQQVTGFDFDGDRISAARTSTGERFAGKNFISNVHPAVTLNLIEAGRIKKSFRNRMNRLRHTLSAFALHLNLKPGVVPYRNYNYQHFSQPDVWYASYYDPERWPEHFFMHNSPPADGEQHISCAGILTYMRFEEVEKWKDLPPAERGADYREWKEQKARKLIELVGKSFPEIKENITAFTVSTPLDYRDYIGSPDGAMYGTARDYRYPMASYISPRTKIPNLFFTGQNLNLHGMMGVSMSTLLTCAEFLPLEDLLNQIRHA